MDEEIIGDESPAYKPHVQGGEEGKLVPPNSRTNVRSGYGQGPPAPIPNGGTEDTKESAKVRLQRLIRDFAHDAVGPGLEVEVQSEALRHSPGASPEGVVQALLRMDRRLSRMEVWPPSTVEGTVQGAQPFVSVALQQVGNIVKGPGTESEAPEADREHSMLTVVQRNGPDLRLSFDSAVSRDRAYTCLRIFQMSVDQSLESQSREAESELTGGDSSVSP